MVRYKMIYIKLFYLKMLPELWHIIFELCSNKELTILKQVSKTFIIDPVLKTRRLQYPREGKCKTHIVAFTSQYFENNLELVLKFLYNTGVDLVKGDIIEPAYKRPQDRIGYQAIFDGHQLIKYYYDWGIQIQLDPSFDIIADKVPFDYWHIFEKFTINLQRYISELIENIRYDRLGDIVNCQVSSNYKKDYVLYTYFKEYFVILDTDDLFDNDVLRQKYIDDDKIKLCKLDKVIQQFKNKLNNHFNYKVDSTYVKNALLI